MSRTFSFLPLLLVLGCSADCSPAQQSAERTILRGVLVAADVACDGFVLRSSDNPVERDACVAEKDLAAALRAKLNAPDAGAE